MITVYSTPKCTDCKATYRSLEKKGLREGEAYRIVDVSADEEALAFILGLGYQQVPVVFVHEDEHWSGYRPDKMMALVSILANAA